MSNKSNKLLIILCSYIFLSCRHADTTPPVISLNGSESMNWSVEKDFVDPGATAFDNHDGDLTSKIITSGTVKKEIGSYSIKYTVSDEEGNSSYKTRNVYVSFDNHSLEGDYSITEFADTGKTYYYNSKIIAGVGDQNIFFENLTKNTDLNNVAAQVGYNTIRIENKFYGQTNLTTDPIKFSPVENNNGKPKLELHFTLKSSTGYTNTYTSIWTKK